MNNEAKDQLLALLQIESQHRQRIDSIWTQYKDAMLVMHGLIFAVVASLITVPGLSPNGRIGIVAFTVFLDMIFLLASRREVERSAAGMQADFAADYRAVTGVEPPRTLYSRALKMKKGSANQEGGVNLLPPNE